MKKKFICFLLTVLSLVPFAIDGAEVTAGGVEIVGSNVPGATFDSTNNVLVLDNYDGGDITFDEFADGSTITIKLKGNNIVSALDASVDAFYSHSNVNLVFNGEDDSYLEIERAFNAINNQNGNIEINNLELVVGSLDYAIIFANGFGNIKISNSVIDAADTEYGIVTEEGNVNIINSELIFDGVLDYSLASLNGGVDIKNSDVSIKNANGNYGIYAYDITGSGHEIIDSKVLIEYPQYGMQLLSMYDFVNSEITIKNTVDGFKNDASGDLNPVTTLDNTTLTVINSNNAISTYSSFYVKNNSKINIHDCEYSIYIDDMYNEDFGVPEFIVSDSEILIDSESDDLTYSRCGIMTDAIVKYKNSTLTFNNLDFAIMNFISDLTFEDTKIDIKSEREVSRGIYEAGGKLVFDNTVLDLDVVSYGVLVDNDEVSESLIEIKGTSYITDEKIAPRVYKAFGDIYYTVLGEETDQSQIVSLDDVWDVASRKVTILTKEEENPNTIDSIILYLGLGITSTLGLGTLLYTKKRFKGLA